jgi:hypothetical protein
MTEAEWLAATDPIAMSRFLCDELQLSRNPGGRRSSPLRLCLLPPCVALLGEESRDAVEIAEGYADGVLPDRNSTGGGTGHNGIHVQGSLRPDRTGHRPGAFPGVLSSSVAADGK